MHLCLLMRPPWLMRPPLLMRLTLTLTLTLTPTPTPTLTLPRPLHSHTVRCPQNRTRLTSMTLRLLAPGDGLGPAPLDHAFYLLGDWQRRGSEFVDGVKVL